MHFKGISIIEQAMDKLSVRDVDLKSINPSELFNVFMEMWGHENKLKVLPYYFYTQVNPELLFFLCVKQAVYFLPTIEFINWMKNEISNKTAIEIGSGIGLVAESLSIKATDAMQQNIPWVKEYYKSMQQQTIAYGKHVEQLEAIDAVKKYNPDIAIGCWVSHKVKDSLISDPFNIDEEKLIKYTSYYMVGHKRVHRKKDVLILDHKTYNLPFLVSRLGTKDNVIWKWDKRN